MRSYTNDRLIFWFKFLIAMVAMSVAFFGVSVVVSFALTGAPTWQTSGPLHYVALIAGIVALFVVLIPLLVWIRKSTPKSAYRKSRQKGE